MFRRTLEKKLAEWKANPKGKPLVIRGARQTGKTTLIRNFAKQYEVFIELNLEKDAHRKIFSEIKDAKEIIQSIEGVSNKVIVPGKTLLFLDEIQNSIQAIKFLRYFHEEMPDLHVITAGSLLEVRMRREGWSFPVGRVDFLYLYPVTFEEFLAALGEEILLKAVREFEIGGKLPMPLHEKTLNLLADYICVGGMPEAVGEYLATKSFVSIKKYHDALSTSFKEDFAKYASESEVQQLKLVWDKIPYEIGARIKYSRLSGGNYQARQMSNAFDILHEAMLVERVHPTTQTVPPLIKKSKYAPKAIYLDIGLCSHSLGLTRDQIRDKIIDPKYDGALSEEFIGQELLASDDYNRKELFFWVREEKGASSEIDYLIQKEGRLIPVEIKSGSQGSLKSLHQFLHRSNTNFGIRFYTGETKIEEQSVNLPTGHTLKYKLLSLPLYLIFRLGELVKQGL